MRTDSVGSHPQRRGYGLIEMAVTGALLAVMVVLCAQIAGKVATQRRMTARREAAARLAADLVEEVRALPWDRLRNDQAIPLATTRLAEDPTLTSSHARVQVTVDPAPGLAGTEARRIVVAVVWPDPTQGAGAPVRLVAWAFAPASVPGGRP